MKPTCPKCLGINLEMHFTDDGCQICYCRNPKCKHNSAPPEFFSAPPAMGAKLPEGKVPNYDTPETIVEHIIGMVADDGSITDYARELAIDYVCTRLLYAGGNYPPASPQLEQVAREIAAYVRGEFLKPLVCKPENDYLLDGLVPILQRHFPCSEGAGERDKCQICKGVQGGVPGNENVIEGVIVCDYCSATLLTWNNLRQAASPPVAAADFKTVNDCIEALNDAAELLKERHGSTGFDASVALIIEQTIQRLKSIETEAAPRKEKE